MFDNLLKTNYESFSLSKDTMELDAIYMYKLVNSELLSLLS